MKGLLQKDFRLMVKQSRFFGTIGFVAVIFASMVKDTSFIISYLTFIGFMFTLSTINYDEFDNAEVCYQYDHDCILPPNVVYR